MKKSFKKLGVIAVILALFVSFTACSFGKSSASNNNNNAQKATENAQNKELKITVNDNKTAQLKKEKAIKNGKVYVQNNKAIATMIVKSGVSDSEAKALAQKYAKEIKAEYKNMPVTVLAVRDNKNVANIKIK